MKKPTFILLIICLAIVLVGVMIVLRGDEDTWLCQGDTWIKHGNPSKPMPASGCGQVSGKNINTNGNINANTNGSVGLANPASVNCVNRGGTLEIRTDENGGQLGICKFKNGKECDEWALFRGECLAE